MTKMTFYLVPGLVLALTLAVTLPAVAAQVLPDEEVAALIDGAETKEDHMKLATHYAAKAEDLAKDAARHEAMGKRYRNQPRTGRAGKSPGGMAKHCRRLTLALRNAAREARLLADAHEDMAEQATR